MPELARICEGILAQYHRGRLSGMSDNAVFYALRSRLDRTLPAALLPPATPPRPGHAERFRAELRRRMDAA